MNSFINALENETNYNRTENGALAHKTTRSKVYDMFALGGAYRNRSDEDCIFLFKEAYDENPTLAVKCLFYLRDCRGGQGERRFFRVCFKWFCNAYPTHAISLLPLVSEYGRWDDLIYCTLNTSVEEEMIKIIAKQLYLDFESKIPSLLGKWMPSENASSKVTKEAARHIIKTLDVTSKEYRRLLTILRKRINIVETLMSQNRWDEIEFDKIPSKAGLIYKNAFARRDIIAKKYEKFIKSADTKVNAATLYPYDVVHQVTKNSNWSGQMTLTDVDRAAINKYWENLPDYFEGADPSLMCVIDTSGSMTCNYGNSKVSPIDVAISLGLYAAERIKGDFANHYISFASRPQFIETSGIDFCDKVNRIYKTNLIDDTNLEAVFDLFLHTLKRGDASYNDLPKTICIISDMQINQGLGTGWDKISNNEILTEMEQIRKRWMRAGYELPNLIYWNVNASKDTFLDLGSGVSYVSGCSPIIFKQVITGKTGYDLMLQTLMDKRYESIK